jgi:hypothetical protein
MKRFWRLTAVYTLASVAYGFAPDGFWEQVRLLAPEFLVAALFVALGPIVSLDFVQPFSIWPFVFETLAALLLFSSYSQTSKKRYLFLLGVLWISSIQAYAYIMGGLSGSPNPLG